jgi:uncharacterized membrane protein
MVMMMFGYGYGAGWPAWEIALMWVGMIAFLGVLICAGYALMANTVRRPRQERHGEADTHRALDGRLARGEIDVAEYQRLRDLIAAGEHQAPAGTGGRR